MSLWIRLLWGGVLKWLRFDIAFMVLSFEVWFGLATPKIGNNEKQLIHHTYLIHTFHCLPVGCLLSFPTFPVITTAFAVHFVKIESVSEQSVLVLPLDPFSRLCGFS